MLKILAQFWRLLIPCIRAPGGKLSLLLFVAAVALNLGAVYASLRLTAWTGAFYSAVEKVNAPEVFRQIGIFAVIIVLNSARGLAHEYIRKVLEIRWRRSLTDHAIGLWTQNKAYWHLAHDPASRIDNPDQRIAEDCRLFTKGLLGEVLELIGKVVGLFSYIALLWSLANFPLSLAFAGLDVEIPRYMLWAAFIYVGISSVVTHLLGRPLKSLMSEQQKREASFRFSMARWRTSFDEVALSNGEAAERDIFRSRFESVADNWKTLIRRQFILGCFTYPFTHSVLRIPLFVALPGYLAGHVAFGGLMQLSMAFSNVVTTLSWFIFSYRDLADLVATSARLDTFLQAAERIGRQPPGGVTPASAAGSASISNLIIRAPDGRELMKLDDMSFNRGDAIWLSGDSGIGKTTLVKTIAGLWPHAEGQVTWPMEKTMILPQKPYCPIGSIAEAAAYPASPEVIGKARVMAALADVGLSHRAADMPASQDDTPDGLSGGEMQRIALARLLIHKPEWAILDEATSALDLNAETELLTLLRRRLPETAFIIIAHRKPLGLTGLRTINLKEEAAAGAVAATA